MLFSFVLGCVAARVVFWIVFVLSCLVLFVYSHACLFAMVCICLCVVRFGVHVFAVFVLEKIIKICSTSPPGGNQVDGLPPASSFRTPAPLRFRAPCPRSHVRASACHAPCVMFDDVRFGQGRWVLPDSVER